MSTTNHFGGTGTAPVPHAFVCDGVQYIGHLTDTQWTKLLGESTMDEQGRILLHKVKTKRMSRTVQCCAYEAANNFIQAMLGGSLEVGDKDWYQNHPLVEPSGLPQNVAVTLINDLVSPYGIGVSEVFLPIGSVVAEDWKPVLGVNPLANLDNSTSDEECERLLGEPTDQYRFKFQSQSPCGAVVMYGASGSHASGGGHAEFITPRGRPRDYVLAIRLARLQDCVRLVPAPSYGERTQMAEVVDFHTSEYAAGKTVQSLIDPPQTYVVNPSSLASGYNSWNSNPKSGREPRHTYKAGPTPHIAGTAITWDDHSRKVAWALGMAAPKETLPIIDIPQAADFSGYYDFTNKCTISKYYCSLICAGSRVKEDHLGPFGASNMQLAFMYCKAASSPKSHNMKEIFNLLRNGCKLPTMGMKLEEYTRSPSRKSVVTLHSVHHVCDFLTRYTVEQYDDWLEQGRKQFRPTIFDTFAYAFTMSFRTLTAQALKSVYGVDYSRELYEPSKIYGGTEVKLAEALHRNLGLGIYRTIMIEAMLNRRDPAYWAVEEPGSGEATKTPDPPATDAKLSFEQQMEMLKEETALNQAYPYN